eukprot:scaffold4244_cov167-Amphora_coffeaeformis.AAC.5
MSPVSPSPSPSPTLSAQSEAKGPYGTNAYDDLPRLPLTDDEAYREILEQCRDFYTFENSSMSFLQPNQLLPRLEDSIMMIEQKRKAKVNLTNHLVASLCLPSTGCPSCPEKPVTVANNEDICEGVWSAVPATAP